jgi:hypothetical protein
MFKLWYSARSFYPYHSSHTPYLENTLCMLTPHISIIEHNPQLPT